MRFTLPSGSHRQIRREISHATVKKTTAKNGFRKTPSNHVIRAS